MAGLRHAHHGETGEGCQRGDGTGLREVRVELVRQIVEPEKGEMTGCPVGYIKTLWDNALSHHPVWHGICEYYSVTDKKDKDMYYYAQGIKYDTTDSQGEFDFSDLPTDMMVKADSIDEVVDIISDKTGWLVLSVRSIIPFSEENPDQVRLEISTDLGFTADFLRELANAIEEGEPFEDYETLRGVAKISWPQE